MSQAIERPFGITVFGSSIMRIEPDIASLRFAVTRLEQHPKMHFAPRTTGLKASGHFWLRRRSAT